MLKKHYFLSLLLLSQTLPCLAQSSNSPVPFYPGNIKNAGFDKTLSFRYISGEIFIIVTIDGKEYNFIYDTGAMTAISDDVLADIGLEEVGVINVSDGRGNKTERKTYILPSLAIGGIQFDNTLAVGADLKGIGQLLGTEVDGIAGANLMRLAKWTINFSKQTLSLTDKSFIKPIGSVTIPFTEGANGSPYVLASYGDSSFYAEFDTGSNNPMAVDDSVYFNNSKPGDTEPAMVYGEIEQSVNATINGREYRAVTDRLKLGGQPVKKVLVNIRDLADAIPTIGTPFMENYVVTLDWSKHLIYLDKKYDKLNERFTTSLGFSAVVKDDRLKVALVWKGSAAEASGIKPGDEIIAINGLKTNKIRNKGYTLIQNLRKAKTVKISILKDGKEMTYELNRYNLLKT